MDGISAPSFSEPFADRFDSRDADLPPALVQAVLQGFKADRPTLIHVPTNPEQISAGSTLSGIRARAMA
jgi:hypothetical protein